MCILLLKVTEDVTTSQFCKMICTECFAMHEIIIFIIERAHSLGY